MAEARLMAKKSFITSKEGSIASYNSTEIADGIGYTEIYLTKAKADGVSGTSTSGAVLISYTPYSDPPYSYGTTNGTNSIEILNFDFDATINRPITIRGNALIEVALYGAATSATDDEGYIKFKAYLIKYDGTTETTIATSSFSDEVRFGVNGSGTPFYSGEPVKTMALYNIPLTKFKKGDILRVTISVYGRREAAKGEIYGGIYHNPADPTTAINGTTDNYKTTRATLYLPRVLDL